MTDVQLYLAIGMPVLAVLAGMPVNSVAVNSINSRLGSIETGLTSLESKFDTKFDILTGKVIELDNRLTRLEERLKH